MEMFSYNPNTFLSDLRQIRKEFFSKHSEGSEQDFKEAILAFLMNNDFISFEQEQQFVKPLEALPETRQGLIVAYLCKGVYDPSKLSSIHINDAQRSMLDGFGIRTFGYGEGNEVDRLENKLREKDKKAFELFVNDINFEDMIRTAQTFVDGRRERLKRTIANSLKFAFASDLLRDEKEEEYDAIPYLREELKKAGYRLKAKTLNDSDKKALEAVALKYLDVMEYLYLSGIGDEIERKHEQIPDEEMIWYESMYDEVIAHYIAFYLSFSEFVKLLFNLDTPSYVFERLQSVLDIYLDKHKSVETLKDSKFSYLMEEDSVC
jgi:hypothetical protein